MINYTIFDILAEDVSSPEIGNPLIWSGKPYIKNKLKKARAATASAAAMMLFAMTALLKRWTGEHTAHTRRHETGTLFSMYPTVFRLPARKLPSRSA